MTHEFERSLLNGIPVSEAASFFLRIKHAGWADAPDETGVLEGQFAVPIEQVVASLTEAAASKFKLMVAYHIFAESMRGLAQHAIGEVFHEHAEHERAAAEAYLKRATVLGGGPVHLPEIETPPASSDPVGIIMMMARAEQEAIALQTELRTMVGETNPLGFQIEAFMVEDQHHLDELWQLLPQDVARTPVIDQVPAGAEQGLPEAAAEEAEVAGPVAEEVAEEEVAPPEPSPELKQAFARGLKLAGIADDIIGGMSPGDKGKLLRQEKLRGLADAVPLQAKRLAGKAGELAQPLMTRSGKQLLGGGAALGGLMGMSSGASMSKKREKELRAGGPINRFRADNPILTGGAMGAATAGSALAGGLMVPKGVALLGALAAGMAPNALASVLDKNLKGREDSAKVAFARGLRKLGFGPTPEPGQGTDPAAAPAPDQQPGIVPQPSMAAPGVQPPMATPPGGRQYAPTNYLEAEETAQRVQEENEAAFYRGKAQEATGQVQSMGAQVQDIQAQLDQLSAQAAESQNQIMAANEEAVRANDNMLNQATLAARMRMGMQQLRAQMMEIASQDPEQLAAAAGGPTPMDVGAQAQQAGMGPAGAPPPGGDPAMGGAPPGDPNAPPAPPGAGGDPAAGGAPPGGSPEPKKPEGESAPKKDGGETTVSIKKGSVKRANIMNEAIGSLPFAAGGAAIGAGAGYLNARNGSKIPNLRQQVDELKGQQDGGFSKAIELGKAQVALGEAEEARSNPMKSALRGGLMGAGMGAGLGAAVPAAISGGKELVKNVGTVIGNMRGA